MTREILLRPVAKQDLKSAHEWYEARKQGLGRRFLDEVQTTFVQIAKHPFVNSLVEDHVRKALVQVFPYRIFYPPSDESVEIIGVLHAKRSDAAWKKRIHPQGD